MKTPSLRSWRLETKYSVWLSKPVLHPIFQSDPDLKTKQEFTDSPLVSFFFFI